MSNDDLVARLWEEVSWVRLYVDPVPVAADLMTEAAARIEADSSRITELEAENATLKAAVGEEGRANRMTIMYERAMAENARLSDECRSLREAGAALAAAMQPLADVDPQPYETIPLDDDATIWDRCHPSVGEVKAARAAIEAWAALSGEPTPGGES